MCTNPDVYTTSSPALYIIKSCSWTNRGRTMAFFKRPSRHGNVSRITNRPVRRNCLVTRTFTENTRCFGNSDPLVKMKRADRAEKKSDREVPTLFHFVSRGLSTIVLPFSYSSVFMFTSLVRSATLFLVSSLFKMIVFVNSCFIHRKRIFTTLHFLILPFAAVPVHSPLIVSHTVTYVS